jgi:hypothetical protein
MMPAVLKHTDCPSCGHRHHFCLPVGELELGHDYVFVCPETGEPACLRPQKPPELYCYPPQGAVHLSPGVPAARS